MTDSWWVKNARDLEWTSNEMGEYCLLAADEFAITLNVLAKGQPMALYHHEPPQEGFLFLRGEAVLIVEGDEVPMKQWDYFHCPPDVSHAIVGSGDEGATCLVLAVGNRLGPDVILYPRDETALKHGAGVEQETPEPREAYARFTRPAPPVEFREEFLTG